MDKYRVWGIEEVAKPEVFRVRPLSEYGTFTAIVELFQRAGNLRKAVDELQVSFMRRLEERISVKAVPGR